MKARKPVVVWLIIVISAFVGVKFALNGAGYMAELGHVPLLFTAGNLIKAFLGLCLFASAAGSVVSLKGVKLLKWVLYVTAFALPLMSGAIMILSVPSQMLFSVASLLAVAATLLLGGIILWAARAISSFEDSIAPTVGSNNA